MFQLIQRGQIYAASIDRFNQDFEPLTHEEAQQISVELETSEHIKKLRGMKHDRDTQAGSEISVA